MIGCRSFSALSIRALRSAGILSSVAGRGLPGTPCCCRRLILPPATSSVRRSAASWPDLVLARNLATVSVCADMRSPLIDETGNELCGEIGIVEIGKMAGAGNHRDGGAARDLVPEMLGV